MPLNYRDLQAQIKSMAAAASVRRGELENSLQRCQTLLTEQAGNLQNLQKLVIETCAREKTLRCAVPFREPLNAHFPLPEVSTACHLISADGSQITPNPHESVFYGLVNVGIFHMQPGSGQAPLTHTVSELIYEEEDPNETAMITEELIQLRRDVSERQALVGYTRNLPAPVITLTDGPLELYHEPRQNALYKQYFDDYLNALRDLAGQNILTAGYIDRPRAALLVNLLELSLRRETSDSHPRRAFAGLSDLALMRPLLQPGERSAVFAMQSSASKEYDGRIALHFFYLNVGNDQHPALARVEIPQWLAEESSAINLLHAVLVEQARQSGAHPYPYALLRAHETAVVRMDEGEALKTLIQQALLQQGLPLMTDSEKLANKKVGQRTRY